VSPAIASILMFGSKERRSHRHWFGGRNFLVQQIPLGRVEIRQKLHKVAVFLASEDSPFE
jgi:hypothetical protein